LQGTSPTTSPSNIQQPTASSAATTTPFVPITPTMRPGAIGIADPMTSINTRGRIGRGGTLIARGGGRSAGRGVGLGGRGRG